jgi:hypothetical protein
MSCVLHVGIWKIKAGYDFGPIPADVAKWLSAQGIPGCIVSVAAEFSPFLRPKVLADKFSASVNPRWQQRGYTHGLHPVFEYKKSKELSFRR